MLLGLPSSSAEWGEYYVTCQVGMGIGNCHSTVPSIWQAHLAQGLSWLAFYGSKEGTGYSESWLSWCWTPICELWQVRSLFCLTTHASMCRPLPGHYLHENHVFGAPRPMTWVIDGSRHAEIWGWLGVRIRWRQQRLALKGPGQSGSWCPEHPCLSEGPQLTRDKVQGTDRFPGRVQTDSRAQRRRPEGLHAESQGLSRPLELRPWVQRSQGKWTAILHRTWRWESRTANAAGAKERGAFLRIRCDND